MEGISKQQGSETREKREKLVDPMKQMQDFVRIFMVVIASDNVQAVNIFPSRSSGVHWLFH
jgi:hypothetical protein